jgi:hypothetical protein
VIDQQNRIVAVLAKNEGNVFAFSFYSEGF